MKKRLIAFFSAMLMLVQFIVPISINAQDEAPTMLFKDVNSNISEISALMTAAGTGFSLNVKAVVDTADGSDELVEYANDLYGKLYENEENTDVLDNPETVTYKKTTDLSFSTNFPECENTVFQTPSEIRLIKTYEATDLSVYSDLRRDKLLLNTEFTLYSDSTLKTVVAVASPVWTDGRATVSFSSELLAIDSTYFLKETHAPSGFSLSNSLLCRLTMLKQSKGVLADPYNSVLRHFAYLA